MAKKDKELTGGKLESLLEAKKNIEKQVKKVAIECPHTKNGHLKVEFLAQNSYDCRCKKCGLEFNMQKISAKELKHSIKILHDAINQIKASSGNPDQERRIIKTIGEIDYNLDEILKIYDSVTKPSKNKNKNKNKKKGGGGNGGYGIDAILTGKKR